jgi:hypothetical protein
VRLRPPDRLVVLLVVLGVLLLVVLWPGEEADPVVPSSSSGYRVTSPADRAGVLELPSTTSSSTSSTTSTTAAPPPTTSTTRPTTTTAPPAPSTTAAPAPAPPAEGGDRLRSTAYCLTGNMASGRPTYVGAVAANRYRLGTRLHVWPNPWGDPNMIFTVEDRHQDGATELDFAMPRECDRALEWGNRRYVHARVIS